MRLFLASIIALSVATPVMAQEHVNGYYRADGTYVAPAYRSSPNSTTTDNWSTRGNVNPYTGAQGTRNPQPVQPTFQTPQPKPRTSTNPYGSAYEN